MKKKIIFCFLAISIFTNILSNDKDTCKCISVYFLGEHCPINVESPYLIEYNGDITLFNVLDKLPIKKRQLEGMEFISILNYKDDNNKKYINIDTKDIKGITNMDGKVTIAKYYFVGNGIKKYIYNKDDIISGDGDKVILSWGVLPEEYRTKPVLYISGFVNNAGIYNYQPGITLEGAIKEAGGIINESKFVNIFRIYRDSDNNLNGYNMNIRNRDDFKNMLLEPFDAIVVLKEFDTDENIYYVVGEVKYPGIKFVDNNINLFQAFLYSTLLDSADMHQIYFFRKEDKNDIYHLKTYKSYEYPYVSDKLDNSPKVKNDDIIFIDYITPQKRDNILILTLENNYFNFKTKGR